MKILHFLEINYNALFHYVGLGFGSIVVVDGGREKQDASDKTHQISDCRNELAAINVLALFHSSACGKFFSLVRFVLFIVESE